MEVISSRIKSIKNMIQQTAFPAGNRKAKVITICSQKGGVGKTTSAVNLGYILAKAHNKRVLLIDLDPQGHVESTLTALVPDGQSYKPLSGILMEKKGDVLEGVANTECEFFDITPGDKTLIETESLMTTKIGKEFILKEAIQNACTHYDVIIIDCPPNLGNLTLNALVASQFCIVPCEMSVLSLEGVSDIFETIDTINERLNRTLTILGILLTRVDSRNLTMNAAIRTQLEEHAKGYLFTSEIQINTDLAKAQLAGKPILKYSGSSRGARNYKELTSEVFQRLQQLLGVEEQITPRA